MATRGGLTPRSSGQPANRLANDEIATEAGIVRITTHWMGATSVADDSHEVDELDDEVTWLFETRVTGGQQDGLVVGHPNLMRAIRSHAELLPAVAAGKPLPQSRGTRDTGDEASR